MPGFFNFLPRIINIIELNTNPQIDNTKYIFLKVFGYISFESFELRSVIINLYLTNKHNSLIKDKVLLGPLTLLSTAQLKINYTQESIDAIKISLYYNFKLIFPN
jgi:hypothetical protein